jgi:hypothetical protein
MDQSMPRQATTYWGFLTDIFSEAAEKRIAGVEEREVDDYVLARLGSTRWCRSAVASAS